MDFNQFEVLSFDCYGTLIDWETGIIDAVKPFLLKNNIPISETEILEIYSKIEPEIQSAAFRNYKTVLREVMTGFAEKFGVAIHEKEQALLIDSMKDWQPFPDTISALKKLKQNHKFAIISNIDDDLFRFSNERLEVSFDWIITAEQVQSYKPSLNNFLKAIDQINLPKDKILHIAQSIFHDIIPAKKVGLTTVWINRRHHKKGFGATPEAYEKPDAEVPDLKSLVGLFKC